MKLIFNTRAAVATAARISNISDSGSEQNQLSQSGESRTPPDSLLTQKTAEQLSIPGKNPPNWKIAGRSAPARSADLTAEQVRDLWPTILEMDKTERAELFSELS